MIEYSSAVKVNSDKSKGRQTGEKASVGEKRLIWKERERGKRWMRKMPIFSASLAAAIVTELKKTKFEQQLR